MNNTFFILTFLYDLKFVIFLNKLKGPFFNMCGVSVYGVIE